MRCSENITFYMLIVFTLSYGEDDLGISRNTLLAAIIISALGSCIVIPFWGALTDRVGRRPVFLWGADRVDLHGGRVLPAAADRVGA